jgi:hypothetical protein
MRRKFLFIFMRIEDKWYTRLQTGFNHLALAERLGDDSYVLIEPLHSGANIAHVGQEAIDKLKPYTVIEADIVRRKCSRLVRPVFQTCTTVCQYLAGINCKVWLVQSLYNKLALSDDVYLRKLGVKEIKLWGQ